MKIYDFTSRKRESGWVVFALTLIKTRKRLAERIVIGRENEVRFVLNGGDGNVYYDEIRPIGSFLFNFEADPNGEWMSRITTLTESYKARYSIGSMRWDKAASVAEFLSAKYNGGEPSAVFTAVRTWEEYLNLYNQNSGAKLLNDRLFMLHKPFLDYAEYRPWHQYAIDALAIAVRDAESQVELWYPVAKRPFETAVGFSSLLPIISYYLTKMNDWKLVFQKCKVCGKDFAAPSRHYALCSDKCRKQKAVEAKQKFNAQTKDNTFEQYDRDTYQFWYNRWRKLKSGKNANPDAAAFKTELDIFRDESVKRKETVKKADIGEKEKLSVNFITWLLQQRDKAECICKDFKGYISHTINYIMSFTAKSGISLPFVPLFRRIAAIAVPFAVFFFQMLSGFVHLFLKRRFALGRRVFFWRAFDFYRP